MDVLLRRYFWVVNLAVVGLCSALLGKAASHMVEGAYLVGDDLKTPTYRRASAAPVTKGHGKEVDETIRRDVFCAACKPVGKSAEPAGGGPASNEPQKTTLQLELVSTMVCPADEVWSMAVLRDLSTKEKDAEMFNRGKKIFATGAVVRKVQSKRVYFDHDGRIEYLELEGAAPATAGPAVPPPPVAQPSAPSAEFGDIDKQILCSGANCTIERALVDKALSNTAALSSLARFVPSVRDGKPNGFKVYAIRPNSLFGKIGLQNGDTLKQINGNEMLTPDQALQLYTKLRSASHLTMQVERRGETVTMDYTIK